MQQRGTLGHAGGTAGVYCRKATSVATIFGQVYLAERP